VDDGTIAEVAASHGLEVPPLSAHSARPLTRGGLLLGYTAFAPGQIRGAVTALARFLEATIGAPGGNRTVSLGPAEMR